MRKALLLIAALFTGPTAFAADYYDIDPTHTYPHFAIDHLGFSTLYGRFDQTTGKMMLDRQNNNGFVSIEIATVSINTGFAKRDEHLRSPDFLNVSEFPDITYKSKNVRLIGEDKAKVEGELTMLGVKRAVDLDVTRIRCGVHPFSKKEVCGFEAQTQINRSDFGSKYGLPGVGDKMTLWFQVEAIKEQR